MKKHYSIYYLFAATIALVAVSCSKESAPDTTPQAVHFTTAIATPSTTRASGAAWAANDRVGIRMFDAQGATVNAYDNRLYTVSDPAAGTLTPSAEDMYYPLDGSKVGFSAYYPYQQGVTETYSINIADQSKPADIDLLYAKTAVVYAKKTTAVPLAFSHQLSKFVIKTQKGAGITSLAGMSVTLNGMPTTASFNLHSGVLGTPATLQTIPTLSVTDGALYEAIVIPGKDIANVTLDFTIGNETFKWKPNALTFEPGKAHEWEVTVSRSAVSGIQGAITDWTTQNNGNGVAH